MPFLRKNCERQIERKPARYEAEKPAEDFNVFRFMAGAPGNKKSLFYYLPNNLLFLAQNYKPNKLKFMTINQFFAFAFFSILCNSVLSQNATMTIKNKSDRYLHVKLMQGPERKAVVYKTDSVAPKGTLVFDVTETGLYFTKLRAILYDKKTPEKNDTIYSKNRPMQMISDTKRGQSNVTIEFTIKESKQQSSLSISRKEYDN